jgi:hypothetical protein
LEKNQYWICFGGIHEPKKQRFINKVCHRNCRQGSAEGSEKDTNRRCQFRNNINNIPTHVMTLKDDGGLVKCTMV